jgi:RND family efflux transporter MFP subunit
MGTIKGAVENELRFEIEGVISHFNYTEGARITQGRSICSLDPKDSYTKADFARSKYSSDQSTYFSTAQRLKTYEELFKMKAISESKLQEARFETKSAEAKMQAALSELELSQSNLAKTNLLAPSDGLLAEILIKAGDFVTPSDVVAKFISGSSTNFEVDVPEKDVNKLKLGMKVKLNCDSQPGKEFSGELAEIAPTVKERTRTTTIKIKLDNPQGILRSGMFGRGTIILTELQGVLLVPTESIVTLGATTFLVPLVKPDPNVPGEGTIEMRTVKPGTKLTKMTVIDSGINPDELVVIETQGQLSDGMRVKFIEALVDKLENQPQ